MWGLTFYPGKELTLLVPEIKDNPQAMEVIAELVTKTMPLMPELEIDGHMSEEFEAKIREKRMPDLSPAEQLTVEIDRFTHDYDTDLYHDNSQSMTEHVSEITEALKQRETYDIALWFADIAAEGIVPEERKRAMELLEKLAEYKPLTKHLEMEEQNDNIVDKVLHNNTGENAQECPMKRTSLKTRLTEKKKIVSGQGKNQEAQEDIKNKQRKITEYDGTPYGGDIVDKRTD